MRLSKKIIIVLSVALFASNALADRGRGRGGDDDDDSPQASPSPTASASASPSPHPSPSPTSTPRDHDDDDDDRDGRSNRGGKVGKKSSSQKVELRSRLNRVGGSFAFGKIDYKAKKNDTRLKANVKVPLPSILPAIADRSEALSTPITMLLSRLETPYAMCDLISDDNSDDEDDDDSLHHEFKLDLRNKKSGFRAKKGVCDTDLTTEGVQSGLPLVELGDTIAIQVGGEPTFLTGTFNQK